MTTIAHGRRTTSARKGDTNQQAILDTAERLLQTTSLRDISIADLASGAGISRSSFYFYFRSKDEVLLALVDRIIAELGIAVVAMGAAIAEDPVGHLTGGIEATARVWREHGPVVRAMTEAANDDEHVRDVWHHTVRRFIDVNAAMIEAERVRGAAPTGGASAAEIATALVWMNERAFHVASLGADGALPDDRIVAVLTEVWHRAIYGGAPA